MCNEFIEYLNSMNNADANNINALAESQVTNKFYNSIRVDRKLGNFIINNINNGENDCYIITGHAGDGKTSLLVQILKQLELLEDGARLEINDIISNDHVNLEYVKDMSELGEERQVELLKSVLEAPIENRNSILISNTGPLLKSFRNLLEVSKEEADDIENILLKQLDDNICKRISIKDYNFYLINIARIENLNFVRDVIKKICSENLWRDCEECCNKEKCPIFFNKNCVTNNMDRVIGFIETYYRWLQENDKRITIRQMISQLTYSFTGNINCYDISKFENRTYTLFNYNFANLFFGYRGIWNIEESNQIKGIELIDNLAVDKRSLDEDYDLFVKGDFSYFDSNIREIVKDIWDKSINEVYISEEAESAEKQQKIRMAIRRFFVMYSLVENNESYYNLYKQIYGEMFADYIKATTKELNKRNYKNITRTIFEALYIDNVGIPPEDNKELYLTLRRHDDHGHQNVLLLLAKAEEKDLEVIQEKRNIEIEDIEERYNLILNINKEESFRLTLPLLMYFSSIVNGEISTELNPSLSHGISKLNSLLLNVFRENEDEENIKLNLVVNTNSGIKEVKIEFDDYEDKIIVE